MAITLVFLATNYTSRFEIKKVSKNFKTLDI